MLAKEKPSLQYWLAGISGSLTIIIYSLHIGQGSLQTSDLALFFAALSASIGYAEGAILTKELGGWRVICYALVISLPLTLPIAILTAEMNEISNYLTAWLGLFFKVLLVCSYAFLFGIKP